MDNRIRIESTEYTKSTGLRFRKTGCTDEGRLPQRLAGVISWRTDVGNCTAGILQRHGTGFEARTITAKRSGRMPAVYREFCIGASANSSARFELSSRAIWLYSESGTEDVRSGQNRNTMGGSTDSSRANTKEQKCWVPSNRRWRWSNGSENIVGIAIKLNNIGNTHFKWGSTTRWCIKNKARKLPEIGTNLTNRWC